MTRSTRVLPLFALVAVLGAACGGGSAAPMPNGPVSMGIVSGNHQTVAAARAVKLPQQVAAQLVRLPSGQVALRTRVLDALLPPRAYAQTAVNGIPGAVVCGVSPDPAHALVPEVPCTNTDASGTAYFTFHADTVAGIARAEVRGTVAGVTQVTDSVTATVLPGAVTDFLLLGPVDIAADSIAFPAPAAGTPIYAHIGDTLDLRARVVRGVHDRYNNPLTTYQISARRMNVVAGQADSASAFAGSDPAFVVGDKVVIRQGDVQILVAIDGVSTNNYVKLQVMPDWWRP